MNKNTATIYDVAEKAGISISTVSRVLNTPDKVSNATKDKVFTVMKELGFIPKAEARERARKHVGKIGIIAPYFTYPSFIHRLRGITNALKGKPFELVIITLEKSCELNDYLQSPGLKDRIDGFIVLSQKFSKKTLKIIRDLSLNTVFVEFGEENYSSVCIDNYRGGEMVADYLCTKGFSSFGVLCEQEKHSEVNPNTLRADGFMTRLENLGFSSYKNQIKKTNNTLSDAIDSARELLKGEFRPQALFATTDFLAVAVIKAAKILGIVIPEDLSIVGFDGTNTSEYMDLTTVDQSLEESGKLAVELLLRHINNPKISTQTIYLPLKIIERDTVTNR